MIGDVELESQQVRLGLGANPTHWSSCPAKPGETLGVDEELIPWELVLIFVGMALDLSGSSWAASRHTLAQGTKAVKKWAPLFRSKWMKGKRKMQLMVASVCASVLWGRALWTLTKAVNKQRGQLKRTNNVHNLGHPAESAGRNRRVVETAPPGGTDSTLQRKHPAVEMDRKADTLVKRHKPRFSEDHWLAKALGIRSVQWWRWR